MHEKRTLAIDVGGTKFSIAVFDGNRMVRRESRRTDAEGGRDWMLDQISTIARGWQQEMPADRCGIGFGGPGIFTEQRVALSTHVGGWRDFGVGGLLRDARPADGIAAGRMVRGEYGHFDAVHLKYVRFQGRAGERALHPHRHPLGLRDGLQDRKSVV